jgi:hypothetical protein
VRGGDKYAAKEKGFNISHGAPTDGADAEKALVLLISHLPRTVLLLLGRGAG